MDLCDYERCFCKNFKKILQRKAQRSLLAHKDKLSTDIDYIYMHSQWYRCIKIKLKDEKYVKNGCYYVPVYSCSFNENKNKLIDYIPPHNYNVRLVNNTLSPVTQ